MSHVMRITSRVLTVFFCAILVAALIVGLAVVALPDPALAPDFH